MKNRIVATSSGILLLVFLALWTSYRTPSPSNVLRVGIGTFSQAIDYGPVYIARHFGWFEQALAEIGAAEPMYLELGGFDEVHTALNQGRLHAFFSAEAPVIKLVSDGQNVKIVEIGCTLQQEVLVTNDKDINSIADLQGMAVAVAEGTSSHYGLLNILESVQLSSADVTLRPGFPGEIKPLFELGEVDAWAVWPPFVEEQVLAGRGVALSGGSARIQSVISLSQAMLDQHEQAALALVMVAQRAKAWMRSNPEEAITIVAQALRLERAVVELSWPKHNWGAELDEGVLSDFDAKAVFLQDVGIITERASVPSRSALIDLRFRGAMEQ